MVLFYVSISLLSKDTHSLDLILLLFICVFSYKHEYVQFDSSDMVQYLRLEPLLFLWNIHVLLIFVFLDLGFLNQNDLF